MVLDIHKKPKALEKWLKDREYFIDGKYYIVNDRNNNKYAISVEHPSANREDYEFDDWREFFGDTVNYLMWKWEIPTEFEYNSKTIQIKPDKYRINIYVNGEKEIKFGISAWKFNNIAEIYQFFKNLQSNPAYVAFENSSRCPSCEMTQNVRDGGKYCQFCGEDREEVWQEYFT